MSEFYIWEELAGAILQFPGNRALINSGLANGHSALCVILSGAKNPEPFGARVVRYPERVHSEGF